LWRKTLSDVLLNGSRKRKRKHRGITDRQLKYLFLLPCIALLVFLLVYPLIWSAYLSFTDYRAVRGQFRLIKGFSEVKPGVKVIKPNFVGFENYKNILRDQYIWDHYRNTGKFVILSVAAQALIGLCLALLFNREFRGKGIITTLILAPMMLSPAIVGLFWKYMLNPNWGVIDYLLNKTFGLPKLPWLSDEKLAMYGIILADTWMWSPFMFLFCLAGVSAITKYLYEAAEVNKASGWFRFTQITFPLMWPLMLIAIIFRTMDAFKIFDIGWAMTQGGPGYSSQTISMLLYRTAFMSSRTGEACAFAYIMLILIISLSNIFIKYLLKAQQK
jgi:multiple sugar transport system permease protein